jgi:hypothetical protein
MKVREPFGYSAARRYPLDEIARDIEAEPKQDAFKRLDPERRVVHIESGDQLEYDGLLLALGAIRRPRFKYALTLDDSRLDEQLHGLIQDVEGGYVHKLAFVGPSRMPWPLPIYELALMTAQRVCEIGIEMSITLATPEDALLAIFGRAVSDAVSRLLADRGILTIPSARCETRAPGELTVYPGSRRLFLDRIVALPQLFGPPTPGVSKAAPNGFIPIDVHCRVRGLDRVFAAGDATDFAVKHGDFIRSSTRSPSTSPPISSRETARRYADAVGETADGRTLNRELRPWRRDLHRRDPKPRQRAPHGSGPAAGSGPSRRGAAMYFRARAGQVVRSCGTPRQAGPATRLIFRVPLPADRNRRAPRRRRVPPPDYRRPHFRTTRCIRRRSRGSA